MERAKRPIPPRSAPLRGWASIFGASAPADEATEAVDPSAGADPNGGDAPHEQESPQASGVAEGVGDVIARSVDLAYRVVDDYLRQGQRAAERLGRRAYGPDLFASDVQDASARLVRYASDVAGLWLDVLDGARAGVPPVAPGGQAAGDAVRPAGAQPDGGREVPAPAETSPAAGAGRAGGVAPLADVARVVLEVATTRAVTVALDLRPGATAGVLRLHALRAVESHKPPLRDVGFVAGAADAAPRLRIGVPADQPAGTYHALVVDAESNAPVGAVSLTLGEA